MTRYADHTLAGRLQRIGPASHGIGFNRFAASLVGRYGRPGGFVSRWGRFLRPGRRGRFAFARLPEFSMALARRRLIAFPDQPWLAEARGQLASLAAPPWSAPGQSLSRP
ncbi:MAG TPA: hypothetical protein VFW40_02780, partial [Capsulimonadaceae bacterium]|nr:hypothetical protein [Capsulimonadaceae bacterium]